MQFHHIGVACLNIAEELDSIRKLQTLRSVSPILHDPEQDVDLCMIETDAGVNIELVAGPRVANLVKKRISYYHVCYSVDNLQTEIERLTNAGATMVAEPRPAVLFGGRKVCFLQASYGLIELLESAINA